MIRLSTKNSDDDYDEKYMNTKVDLDDMISLSKTIEVPRVIIVLRAVFHKNKKYHRQISLDGCLYKLYII